MAVGAGDGSKFMSKAMIGYGIGLLPLSASCFYRQKKQAGRQAGLVLVVWWWRSDGMVVVQKEGFSVSSL